MAARSAAERGMILSEAIHKAEGAGWLLAIRLGTRAELRTPDGREQLYIEVEPNGDIGQRRYPEAGALPAGVAKDEPIVLGGGRVAFMQSAAQPRPRVPHGKPWAIAGVCVAILLGALIKLSDSRGAGTGRPDSAQTSPNTGVTYYTGGAAPGPANASPQLEVQSFTCTHQTFGDAGGFAYVQGQVKNISSQPLSNVMAVGTWYTSDSTFVRVDDALIEFNPILPGQISPFKTIGSYNPAMARCSLGFKTLLGGAIPSTRAGQ